MGLFPAVVLQPASCPTSACLCPRAKMELGHGIRPTRRVVCSHLGMALNGDTS